MGNIQELKQSLKNSLPTKGIRYIIETLKSLLPENSPKHTLLLNFEAEFREHKLKTWDLEEYSDKARKDDLLDRQIIEFIDLLEEKDFDSKAKSSNLSKDNKIKKGHILYKVPQKMQLQKESKCIVRIAFDKELLVEDLDIDEDTKFKAEIRISDSMKVELDDSANPDAFEIRTGSEAIQFIDQDDFTEWRFFVKPLIIGQHILEVRVSIMLEVNGETRVRERVLEESVVIISEEVKEEPEFKKLPEELLMAQGGVLVPAKNSKGIGKKGIPQIAKTLAMGLVFIMAMGGISYAMGLGSQEIDWLIAKFKDNVESYENYVDKYRDKGSRHLESAMKKVCDLDGTSPICEEIKNINDESGKEDLGGSSENSGESNNASSEGGNDSNSDSNEAPENNNETNVGESNSSNSALNNQGGSGSGSEENSENGNQTNEDESTNSQSNTTNEENPNSNDGSGSENQTNGNETNNTDLGDQDNAETNDEPDGENTSGEENTETNPPPRRPITGLLSFKDLRDHQSYKYVKIGDQIWMAENLNYNTAKSLSYNNDELQNRRNYGKLYDWESAKNACPEGWHLPTKKEWIKMLEYAGGYFDQSDRNNLSEKGDSKLSYSKLIKGGELGFSAQFGGGKYEGYFSKIDQYGFFWSSSGANSKTAFTFGFAKSASGGKVFLDKFNKNDAFSCRCVKD